MEKQKLPTELYLQVFETVEHEIPEKLDEPGSLLYWCLEFSVLNETWVERLERQKRAWNESAPPLCQIDRCSRSVMLRRLKAFSGLPTLQNFETSGPSQAVSLAMPATAFYNHRRLLVFSEEQVPWDTWEFVISKSQTWESLTFDFNLQVGNMIAVHQALSSINLPNLERLTFRAASHQHWLDDLVVRRLAKAAPNLQHLTIFHLLGTTLPAGFKSETTCSLKSLHLRGLRRCNRGNLQALLSKSHHSLQELTVVLDSPPQRAGRGQRFYRGIGATDLQASFASCLEIRILRVADRVAKLLDYESLQTRELDPPNNPLGFILDNMVRTLPRLEVLAVWGGIFSMELFENLKVSGCRLKVLSIENYPHFPIWGFLRHLKENEALSNLETLSIGLDLLSTDETSLLSLVCSQCNIKLQFLLQFESYEYVILEDE
ncbi:hypothetical protein O181_065555 [Austropuccinia psidii MF-1]|uniref:F-box domain-containing protein n=1 Tax=Austropuccinia psidii MF-1 TaxID=1389203 RepID=A0A9Q3EMF9_9BASI|nr:hypothetical protein [Austropuccinia psidii MF-1]